MGLNPFEVIAPGAKNAQAADVNQKKLIKIP